MRVYGMFLWLCVCLTYACTQKVDSANGLEIWSEAKVQNQLAFRWSEGDTLPTLHTALRGFFPQAWDSFTQKELSSSGIYEKVAFFSHAETVYLQSDGYFLEVYVADYSSDKGAFLRLIQEYEKVRENQDGFQQVWKEEERGVFAWERLDEQSQLHYLEGGAYARFHILLRTNLPEGRRTLAQAWQKLNWAELKDARPKR